MQNFAVLGGTFNPVHWGHLLLAEAALNQAPLDQIIWVPAYHPPHKPESEILLSFEHRYAMVQQATADHPNFVASAIEATIEQAQSGRSYAVHTLQALQLAYPDSYWYWVIGLDAFRSLPRWYGSQALAEQCCWLVAPRSSMDADLVQGAQALQPEGFNLENACLEVEKTFATRSVKLRWQILEMPLVEVSSSLVRRYCQEQRSIRYLVPDSVRNYILTQKLYTAPNLLRHQQSSKPDSNFSP